MARDLGKLEDDMGSIETLRGKRRPMVGVGGGAPVPPVAPAMGAKRPMANPADAGVYTADKGMPPSPDDMGSIEALKGKMRRPARPGMKKGGCVKKMKSGGSTGSASKRADGIAQKGKTKGKML